MPHSFTIKIAAVMHQTGFCSIVALRVLYMNGSQIQLELPSYPATTSTTAHAQSKCYSIGVTFTVLLTDVPHPTDGSVSVVALNEAGKVRVTWSRPALGPGQVITGYSVQYRRRGTTSYTTRSVSASSTTSYTITNLNLGTVYEVRVASVGPLGLSGYCCGNGKEVTTSNSE